MRSRQCFVAFGIVLTAACGGAESTDLFSDVGAGGASAFTGGAPGSASGGSPVGTSAGATGTSSGAASNGGTGGTSGADGTGGIAPATGGVPSGGAAGSAAGGASPGGEAGTGGAEGGSSPAGGSANGGASGGDPSSGGGSVAEGGAATGGAATGGTGGSSGVDCPSARKAMDEALKEAQACNPRDDDGDAVCTGFVEGECCPVPVNDPDSEATQHYLEALAIATKLCSPVACAAVLCPEPRRASCEPRGKDEGRCVARSLSLAPSF